MSKFGHEISLLIFFSNSESRAQMVPFDEFDCFLIIAPFNCPFRTYRWQMAMYDDRINERSRCSTRLLLSIDVIISL